ncbi:hypothetical protein Cch01nite_32530 [Cellulomonas chitinilytica]|uniref:Uncharacterized protein n=1 Tax=Cellulomonas chitinilytica TaxID=398759 RepID=A0A919P7T7_9CELL|nr:hypothetical protein Cch01nite_32530 [Cellulomonas chitinilytica]
MGALSRTGAAPLAARVPAAPRVRLRVRIPLDVLEATHAGLQDVDDQHRPPPSDETPPPLPL